NILSFAAMQGVELRHPFYDRRLSEYLFTAPGHLFKRGAQLKVLLREAMRGTLTEAIRVRQSKASFVTPFVDAMDRFSDDQLGSLEVVRRGWVDGGRLIAYRAAHRRWRKDGASWGQLPSEPLSAVW